jgi:hypothetical protein
MDFKKLITNTGKKFGFSHFTKLRIFHQILIVISILLLFFLIQGTRSIIINDTMMDSNRKLFQSSVKNFNNLSTVRVYIEQIRASYLEVLTGRAKQADLLNAAEISGGLQIASEWSPRSRG